MGLQGLEAKVDILSGWGLDVGVVVKGCPNLLALSKVNLGGKMELLEEYLGERAQGVVMKSPAIMAYGEGRIRERMEVLKGMGKEDAIGWIISKSECNWAEWKEKQEREGGGRDD